MLFLADLVRQKNNHATDSDIRIDDVSENAVGDALEDVCTKGCADDDSTETETVICQNGGSEEAVIGTNKGHHHIANQEVRLRHCHIVLLRGFRLDEVEDGGRALHPEKAAHQSAECASTNLNLLCCRQFDLLAE